MKISISSTELANKLKEAMLVCERKNTILVLTMIKIVVEELELRIIASNGSVHYRTSIALDTLDPQERTAFLIKPEYLANIVNNYKGSIYLEIDDDKILKVKAGRGKYNISTIDEAEFIVVPEQPYDDLVEYISAADLSVLKEISKAASPDDYKPAMECVNISNDRKEMAATDGFRLYYAKTNITGDVLIHKDYIKIANSIKWSTNDIAFYVNKEVETDSEGNQITKNIDYLLTDHITYLFFPNINERFPPYETIIPGEFMHIAEIDRKEWLKAFKSIEAYANIVTKLAIVDFQLNGTARITASDEETHQNAEFIVSYTGTPFEFGIGVKIPYIIETLEFLLDDIVTIKFNDASKGFKIDNTTRQTLNMPIRYK